MRKFTPRRSSPDALVAAGMRRVRLPGSKYKQLGYGVAIVLAVLTVPFAVRAMSGDLLANDVSHQGEAIAEELINQPKVEAEPKASGGTGSMNSDIKVESQTKASDPGKSNVDVMVNGQNVPVPENGSVRKHISDNNGETTVDIRVDNDSSSQSSSSTVAIEQHSYSSGDITQDEGGTGRHPARR